MQWRAALHVYSVWFGAMLQQKRDQSRSALARLRVRLELQQALPLHPTTCSESADCMLLRRRTTACSLET